MNGGASSAPVLARTFTTVKVNGAVALPNELVTVIENAKDPVDVVVPEMMFVPGPSVSPGGSDPLAIAKVGAGVPVALTGAE
jgi:hypothetical protein